MTEPLFVPASFFFLRSPRWPVEKGRHLLDQELWVEKVFELYKTDELLQEAIAIASPSLYEMLQKKQWTEDTAISLLNYMLRMATRATPFGLFSFVATGSWGSTTAVSFDLDQVKKRARPDMAWVFAFIQKLYADEQLFPTLPIRTNPFISLAGERYSLSFLRSAEKDDQAPSQASSIRATKLVKAILSLAKESKGISVVCDELRVEMPILESQKVYGVIQQLLTQQFLLPGLLPSILSLSPFENILPQLPESAAMGSIADKIKAYQQTPPGKGVESFAELKAEMGAMVSMKTTLQVDSVYEGSSPLSLPCAVGKELCEAASILWQIAPKKSMTSSLQIHHSKFLETYGTHRTVPLMELINEDMGLGPLEKNASLIPLKPAAKFTREWEKWLYQQWQDCLREQKSEIVLSRDVIDRLLSLTNEKSHDPNSALLSMDLFCKIIADSPAKVDEGDFLLHLTQPSWQGGSSIGRFIDLLDEKAQCEFGNYIAAEEELEKGALFVEVSYWPKTGHNANVATHPCFRKYRLDTEAKKRGEGSLSLDDIYVGATLDRYYLTLKPGGCEVITRVGNFLNPMFAPAPLQFMREVTLTKYQLIYSFSWGLLAESAAHLPRVRFQKTIISPALWNVDASLFYKETPEKIALKFTSWADHWKLPTRCLLIRGDQQLYIDRHHPAHLRDIVHKLKKMESLQFTEETPMSWAKSDEGHHLCEVVVPVLKNPVFARNESVIPPAYISIDESDRVKLPGSEWLFIKLYLEEEGMGRFLVDQLSHFYEQVQREVGTKGLFFIRYRDPEPHIRFRMRLNDPESISSILIQLNERAQYWMKSGMIKNMVLAGYEREVERYGGPELMEAAEAIFCADSLSVFALLRAVLNKSMGLAEPVLHALSVVNFLKGFGHEYAEIMAILNSSKGATAELKGFREYRSQLIEHVQDPLLEEVSILRREAQAIFRTQVGDLPPSVIYPIYNSLLHMHCNRLGCNLAAEQRARLYALHTLTQLEHRAANAAR